MAYLSLLCVFFASAVWGYDTGIINFADNIVGVDNSGVVGSEVISFWNELEPEEGSYDWSSIDDAIKVWSKKGKKVDIRVATVHNQPFNTPRWLYEKYNVRLIGRGYWCDFERGSDNYVLSPGSKIVDAAENVLSGEKSLLIPAGQFLLLDPKINLEPEGEYCVQFSYTLLRDGEGWIKASKASGGDGGEKVVTFQAEGGVISNKVSFLKLDKFSDYRISIGSDNSDLVIDNVNVIKIVTKPKWTVETFADNGKFVELLNCSIVDDPSKTDGSFSVHAKNDSDSFCPIIRNDPVNWRLEKGKAYAVRSQIRAITDSDVLIRFYNPAIKKKSGDETGVPVFENSTSLKAGSSVKVPLYGGKMFDTDDYIFEVALRGKGEVFVEDIAFMPWSDKVVGFPNYFDDNFKRIWKRFVEVLADRYNGNPNVGVVSVGGFGRWEEVMLDGDHKGMLDEQWLAFGFTQQKYLRHISWAMDVYKDRFPDKDLRICLAYGLHNVNDVDWMYRRVAQQAVKCGIGLKQNGLSERYDSWNYNTNASYLFENYRDDPNLRLTFETGGQIYRDQNLVIGHPLSLINRAMLSGVDNLFLYGSDIGTRNVAKYLSYATSQMGSQLFTTFYNRFGDYSMVNDHSPNPIEYHNIWLGLRQLPVDGSNYTQIEGQKCAVTGNDDIVIDIDDRYQYSGLYSPVLAVEYYDQGTDSFTVSYPHLNAGEKINKTDTGKWKWAYFYRDIPVSSSRNRFEDIHNDIVISSDGDGPDYFKSIELSFVPAKGWQKRIIAQIEPGEEYLKLSSKLECRIDIPQKQKIDFVSIPLWSDIADTSYALLRVRQKDGQNERRIEKEIYLPADKQWVDIPVSSFAQGQLIVEMLNPEGSIGWYISSNGQPAYKLSHYATLKAGSEIFNLNHADDRTSFDFAANKPFCGIDIDAMDADYELKRILPDGQTYSIQHNDDKLFGEAAYFSPLSAGNYRIELDRKLNSALLDNFKLTLYQLIRLNPAHTPLTPETLDVIKLWQLNDGSTEGCEINGQIETYLNPDGLNIRVGVNTAEIIFSGIELAAKESQYVNFTMKNETASGLTRLLWADANGEFNDKRSVYIPVVANDEVCRQYSYQIGLEDAWDGKITSFKFEPVTGMCDAGTVLIKDFAIKQTSLSK